MRTQHPNPQDPSPPSEFAIADLRLFGLVVGAGSLNGAARRHGVSKSVLSRALAKLERAVGGPLVDRTQRGVVPTTLGEALLPVAERAVAVVRDAEQSVRGARDEPQGELRIAASAFACQRFVAPVLAELVRRHPLVRPYLRVDGRGPDPMAAGLDVTLRAGRPDTPHLVSRRVLESSIALYAARSAARGSDLADPEAVERLGRIALDSAGRAAAWTLTDASGRARVMDAGPIARASDPIAAVGLLEAGLGVAPLADWDGAMLEATGAAVHALPGWSLGTIEIHAVMPPRRTSVPAVRAFLDLLIERGAPRRPGAGGGATRA